MLRSGSFAVNMHDDGTSPKSVVVKSSSCNADDRQRCARSCRVTLEIPREPASGWGKAGTKFKIVQLAGDESHRVTVFNRGPV